MVFVGVVDDLPHAEDLGQASDVELQVVGMHDLDVIEGLIRRGHRTMHRLGGGGLSCRRLDCRRLRCGRLSCRGISARRRFGRCCTRNGGDEDEDEDE